MTIKEVAQLAGVSPAAVSRYLNGGSISPEKRERVRKAIEETGYRPNPMAQTMRTGRINQVGIIVPRLYSDSVSQITGMPRDVSHLIHIQRGAGCALIGHCCSVSIRPQVIAFGILGQFVVCRQQGN